MCASRDFRRDATLWGSVQRRQLSAECSEGGLLVPVLASQTTTGGDKATRHMSEAHAALRHVLVLSALASRPERVDPALGQELFVQFRDRNRGVRMVFSHQLVFVRLLVDCIRCCGDIRAAMHPARLR